MGLGSLGAALLAELVCRTLPVNQSAGFVPVSADQPIARLRPGTTTTRSRGPRLSLVTRVEANNAGFRHADDYVRDSDSPLVALVGDSYVSASTVLFEETMAGRLSAAVEGQGRVYSFGLRGAAFPQYLAWATHARDEYAPDGFCFLVIANDFWGSLTPAPSYHYFRRNEDDSSELVRVDSRHNWRRSLTDVSALARYLFLNCQIEKRGLRFVRRRSAEEVVEPMRRFVGNIPVAATDTQMESYRWAFDAFLERLPEATGVPPDRILLVMDGMRPHMYRPEDASFAETSAWAALRHMVRDRATEAGVELVDLHPLFVEHFAEYGVRFDSDQENHWNGLGHGIAAEAALRSRALRGALAR